MNPECRADFRNTRGWLWKSPTGRCTQSPRRLRSTCHLPFDWLQKAVKEPSRAENPRREPAAGSAALEPRAGRAPGGRAGRQLRQPPSHRPQPASGTVGTKRRRARSGDLVDPAAGRLNCKRRQLVPHAPGVPSGLVDFVKERGEKMFSVPFA